MAENNNGPETEIIRPELKPLVSRVLECCAKDLQKMKRVLERGDFTTMQRLAHSTKGAGMAYGFKKLAEMGRELESRAKAKDTKKLDETLQKMTEYLKRVRVRYESDQD